MENLIQPADLIYTQHLESQNAPSDLDVDGYSIHISSVVSRDSRKFESKYAGKLTLNHIESIEEGIKNRTPHIEIVRKIYLSYPTQALIGDEERQYEILNEISCHFKVPIMSIQIAGSAKTGRSFHKQRDFVPGSSDLDVAIIDPNLYRLYVEEIFSSTKGHSDKTGFSLRDGKSVSDEYLSYLTKGIFRADLMPTGEARKDWNKFFGSISRKHGALFKSISANIYMSQIFFESKQRSAIKNYIDNKAV